MSLWYVTGSRVDIMFDNLKCSFHVAVHDHSAIIQPGRVLDDTIRPPPPRLTHSRLDATRYGTFNASRRPRVDPRRVALGLQLPQLQPTRAQPHGQRRGHARPARALLARPPPLRLGLGPLRWRVVARRRRRRVDAVEYHAPYSRRRLPNGCVSSSHARTPYPCMQDIQKFNVNI